MSEQQPSNFAVIRLNSKQYIVKKGSRIKADRVAKDTPVEVLLAEIDGNLIIGEPATDSVGVRIEIVEEKKDQKVEVRRYKSKSKYRKHKGHRQPISMIYVAEFGNGVKNEIVWNLLSDRVKTETVEAEVVEKPVKSAKPKSVKKVSDSEKSSKKTVKK